MKKSKPERELALIKQEIGGKIRRDKGKGGTLYLDMGDGYRACWFPNNLIRVFHPEPGHKAGQRRWNFKRIEDVVSFMKRQVKNSCRN